MSIVTVSAVSIARGEKPDTLPLRELGHDVDGGGDETEGAKREGGNDGVQDADRVWRVIGGDSDVAVKDVWISNRSVEGEGEGEGECADKDGTRDDKVLVSVFSATDDDSVRERGECSDEKEKVNVFDDELGDKLLGEKEGLNQPLCC
ncbi:hypothetical protein BGZ93_006899 [Podila epicladia]|nr:hypothetical protein BGZ93_006899 [Podila epicladia]